MENEIWNLEYPCLIPLSDFKAVLSVDDRDDQLSLFCLTQATSSIETYCKRFLLARQHSEVINYYGEFLLPLGEYPVREILMVYGINALNESEILEHSLYWGLSVLEDAAFTDVPYLLRLSPVVSRLAGIKAVKIVYKAGYECGSVPPDLASACMELAAWNMTRYKGRRIGLTGAIRGKGKDGEHLESSMPENVRCLLEPYCRKTI
ncbi:hypothetical protein FACS1894161_1110 [Spirochaetia bacterium]|nr:hypothetical protein FACS1894161_1110 [Spirochaetia bacterium]